MSGPDKPPRVKEMTYRTRWKKGTIRTGQAGAAAADAQQQKAPAVIGLMRRFVWRKTPFLPDRIVEGLLWALPVIAFAASLWLAYALAALYK